MKTIGTRRPRIEIATVTDKLVQYEIHHQDHVTFVHLFISVTHQAMAKMMAQWFVHLPKGEQTKLIESMQKIRDKS